jgi:nucleotide-binding universal stress UspA family protein
VSEAIVVGTEGSETSAQVVDEAVRLARALGATVHLVSAYQPSAARVQGAPEGAAKVWAERPDSAVERVLEQASASVRLGGVEVETCAVRGDPVDALIDVAKQVGASMIVVGSQGRHGARRLLGSVPNQVAHKAECTVVIVSTHKS